MKSMAFWNRATLKQKSCLIFLTFNILMSQVFLPFSQKKEIFPFFDWSLFSSYQRPYEDMSVGLTKNGKVSEVFDCTFISTRRSERKYFLVQKLAREILSGADFLVSLEGLRELVLDCKLSGEIIVFKRTVDVVAWAKGEAAVQLNELKRVYVK